MATIVAFFFFTRHSGDRKKKNSTAMVCEDQNQSQVLVDNVRSKSL